MPCFPLYFIFIILNNTICNIAILFSSYYKWIKDAISSLINLVSRRKVNPELFAKKDDKNSKDFQVNAAPRKAPCKRADSSPVFFIQHMTQPFSTPELFSFTHDRRRRQELWGWEWWHSTRGRVWTRVRCIYLTWCSHLAPWHTLYEIVWRCLGMSQERECLLKAVFPWLDKNTNQHQLLTLWSYRISSTGIKFVILL